MNKKLLVWLAIILGLVFCVIGYVYASHQAGMLPHYFPGYTAGATNTHVKHSIAAFVLAAACFIYAWFVSGPSDSLQQ